MANFTQECGINALNFARTTTLGLLEDLSEEQLCHQAIDGANHALWVLGHVAVTDDYMLEMVGKREKTLPSQWYDLFGQGSQVAADQSKYPSMNELKAAAANERKELIGWFQSLSEEQLAAPLPEPIQMFAPNFATLASTIAWHEGMHAGQITVARKSLGIGPKFG